jgi:prephenate dehydrogenase
MLQLALKWFNMNQSQKLGIIGNLNFTKFIVPHLEKYFQVQVFGREEKGESDLLALDYLIFSVPLASLEEVCKEVQNKLSSKTVLIDVTNVKEIPLQILQKYFPEFQILGTHPIFGPQSGKNGIENLPIVLCNVNLQESIYAKIKNFLSQELKLKVIEKTATEHDEEMAYVYGLSHFIGRALFNMGIQEYEAATKGYNNMIQLKETVGYDTWELYKTIQKGNNRTEEIRKKFLEQLEKLEYELNN